MQQMRGGMIQANGIASLFVDTRFDLIADTQFATAHLANVDMRSVALEGVRDFKRRTGGVQRSRIPDLATALGIKWRGIQDDLALFTDMQHFQLLITAEQGDHGA